MLSKRVFDQLPQRVKVQLKENDCYDLLSDGSQLQFYGVIRLEGWIPDVKIEDNFVMGQINEDAILGMLFLSAYSCKLTSQSSPAMTKSWSAQIDMAG